MPNSLIFENDTAAFLEGEISFKIIPTILKKFKINLKANQTITIDLTKLTNGQTIVLSLMLEFKRLGQTKNTILQFTNIPKNLQKIAKLNGIDSFL